MDSDATYTVAEAAEMLGVSRYQVYRRIVRGDLPALSSRRNNVHYLIPQESLHAYVDAGGADNLSAPHIGRSAMMRPIEVAIATGYSVETIRRMCRVGRLSYIKGAGEHGHYRIPREEVERLCAETGN